MHQVWRKRQGLEWYPAEPKGFVSNASHISNVEAKPNFAAQGPTELSEAYGRGAAPKLVQHIEGAGADAVGSDRSTLRLKAIQQAHAMMKDAQQLSCLLTAGIVPALNVAAIKSPDEKIRQAAVEAIGRLARERAARELIVEHETCRDALLGAVTDPVREVRLSCLGVVQQLATTPLGIKALVACSFVKQLVDRCRGTPDGGPPVPEVQAIAATAMGRICQTEVGREEALSVGAVEVALKMLKSEHHEVRYQSAYCLAVLTYDQQEKAQAWADDVMEPVVQMLQSDDSGLQTAACALLMSMSNGTRFPDGRNACKKAAVQAGAVEALDPLLAEACQLEAAGELNEPNSELAVYACKCMASLSDLPKARVAMEPYLTKLKTLVGSSQPILGKHAQIAIERITWTP